MCVVYSAGVQGKLYRLWYKLNKNTRIALKTGVCLSDKRDMFLGQGTDGGALASALNVYENINTYFEDSPVEISYGSTRLQPVSFQDDILRVCDDRDAAQEGFNRLEAVFKSKLLHIHPKKSCFIVFGNSKTKKIIENEISARPLIYDNFSVNGKARKNGSVTF